MLSQPSSSQLAFSRMKSYRYLVLFLSICLALAARSYAQSSTGGVQGTVADPQGALIQRAEIAITNVATGAVRGTRTNNDGWFRVDGLYPGNYHIEASAPQFSSAAADVVVTLGENTSLRLRLSVAGVPEAIQVRENSPDASSAVIGTPVTHYEIENTPLANRSFANIAYVAPMTAPVEPSDPTKARITAVSFAGSSGLNVDFSIDGGDNNDDYIGGFLQNFSPEALREFNVRTALFEADTSRTNGASIIATTNSGTNNWHGSVSSFFRASALNARNVLDNPEPNPKQPYSKQDVVGALGGPIIRDRLWFFTTYEYNHEDASVAYSNSSLAEFHALAQLAATGQIPGVTSIAVLSSVVVPFRDSLFDGRLDWQQSERSHWFLRYGLDRYTTHNDLVQQAALPSTGFTSFSNFSNVLVSNQLTITPKWQASLVVEASLFNHNKVRNSDLGLALAFPFTTTSLTTSGFETFGDNQFITAISAFPIERDQQKYQVRYDVSHAGGAHTVKFGMNLIHEPVLRGRFADSAETLVKLPNDPIFYISNPGTFAGAVAANASTMPAADGRFRQNVQRVGFYVQDSWRMTPHLALDYGVRYDTTFGLFIASGHDQTGNAALQALHAASVSFADGIPHDFRGAISPRLGVAYAPGKGNTVFRAGVGMFYNDLAQNGWAEAFQAVNGGPNPPSAVIDPRYHSPYALQAGWAVEHAIGNNWKLSAQYEHHQGVHQYRRYQYVQGISLPPDAPSTAVFRSDNRSRYDGLSAIVQHHGGRYDLTAHYTLAKATTWGATVGELFDYVNGVTNALHPFGPGDHGPSGEDIRHRFVVQGVFRLPANFQASTLAQFESARPYTMTTPVDINGDGNFNDRAVVNGVQTSLDQFRGKPFSQIDLRVSRDFHWGERVTLSPMAEFFNLLDRTNPGNNFIPDISALPITVNSLTNATAYCVTPGCSNPIPIRRMNDLRFPAGALGDFFGPGTTVGRPFGAQLGFKVSF